MPFDLPGLLKVLPKHIEDMDLHTGARTNNDPGLHLSTSLRVSLGRALGRILITHGSTWVAICPTEGLQILAGPKEFQNHSYNGALWKVFLTTETSDE